MLLEAGTGNILQFDCGSAGSIRGECSFILVDTSTPPVVQSMGNAVIAPVTGATANTALKAGTASRKTRILSASLFNDHTSVSNTVTVEKTDGTNTSQLVQAMLLPGESLYYTGSVWIHYDANGVPTLASEKLDAKLRVTSDVVNATTSFADVTGLTVALKSGKAYVFEAMLFHQTNATTTGAQFGVNIGATPTVLNLWGNQQITASVTAAAFGSSAMVTAVDTAAVVETTGPGAVNMVAYITGYVVPSADGTFAIRCKSEVAVASGLTIKAGSWLRIWECDS